MRLSKVAAAIASVPGISKPPAAVSIKPQPQPQPKAPADGAVGGIMPLKPKAPNADSKIVTSCDQAYYRGFMDKLSQENIDPAILESLIKLQTRSEERPAATIAHGAARGLTVGAVIGAVLGALGGGLLGAAQPQDKLRHTLEGAGIGTGAGALLGAAQGVPAGILARFASK